jgi:hypothetical protein
MKKEKEHRKQNVAAIKIQAVWRGYREHKTGTQKMTAPKLCVDTANSSVVKTICKYLGNANHSEVDKEMSTLATKVLINFAKYEKSAASALHVSVTSDVPCPLETPLSNHKPRNSILKSVMCNLPVPSNTALNNDIESVIDESSMKIQHSSVETEGEEVFKVRRSLRIMSRKVTFEAPHQVLR